MRESHLELRIARFIPSPLRQTRWNGPNSLRHARSPALASPLLNSESGLNRVPGEMGGMIAPDGWNAIGAAILRDGRSQPQRRYVAASLLSPHMVDQMQSTTSDPIIDQSPIQKNSESEETLNLSETQTVTFASESNVQFFLPHSNDHAGVIG